MHRLHGIDVTYNDTLKVRSANLAQSIAEPVLMPSTKTLLATVDGYL